MRPPTKELDGLFYRDSAKIRNTLKKSPQFWGPMPQVPPNNWRPPEFPNLSAAKVIGVDTETYDPELMEAGPGWGRGKGHIIGASLAVEDGTSWYFPIRHGIGGDSGAPLLPPEHMAMNMDPQQVLRFLDHTLHDNRPKVGANLIYDVGWLMWEGVRVNGPLYDIQFAEALLNSEEPDVSLDNLSRTHLGVGKVTDILYDWLSSWNGRPANDRQRAWLYITPPCLAGPYAEADAQYPIKILESQWPKLAARGVLDVFSLECRLIPLLVRMRLKGTPVDVDKANQIYDELGHRVDGLDKRLKDMLGFDVNTGSGQSMTKAFQQLGIPVKKKVSKDTGEESITFDKKSLESIDHPFTELVLEQRGLTKVRDTFVKSYIIEKNVNGRLYCSFHPLKSDKGGTRSGRLACVEANTPILTRRGIVPIKDIVVGDNVWTHKKRWRKVLLTHIKPDDAMYEVTLSSGQTITCTAKHRFLCEDGVWRELNDIAPNLLQPVTTVAAERPAESAGPSHRVSEQRREDSAGDIQRVCDEVGSTREVPDGRTGDQGCDRRRGLPSTEAYPVQPEQARGTEPDDGNSSGEPSDVQEWSHRRGRTSVQEGQRSVRSKQPLSNVSDVRNSSEVSGPASCSSHQRGRDRRQSGQPRIVHTRRTWGNTREPEGQQVVTIEKVTPRGSLPVYDITVHEDESYQACGVFNHNSSDPNLQNIPVRTAEGKLVREAFAPKHGGRWRSFDYSSIEYRLLAHFAVGKGADEVRAIFAANPKADYHAIVGDLIFNLAGIKLARGPVKNINFGIIYGMAESKLAGMLKLPKAEASDLMSKYHAAAPYARATMDMCANEVHSTGMVRTILNRVSDFPLWSKKGWSDEGRLNLPYEEAKSKWGMYNIERAMTHKALNRKLQGSAADVMKKAMVDAYEAGLFEAHACGIPSLTVHDELDFEDYGVMDNPAWAELKRTMENCMVDRLRVPLLVEGDVGPNWAAAH